MADTTPVRTNRAEAQARRTSSPVWDVAVGSAASRVDAGWVLRDTRCQSGVAEELAALLCAYGAC